jgi:arylsulfatase A-like enzyme
MISPGMALKDVLPRLTEEALQVIETHVAEDESTRKPLFVYLALTGPHTPWLPSPEFVGKSGAGLYGDFTMMVDAQVGKILAALDRHGLSQNTLVLFTSDNGPVWYDADKKKFGHDSSGGWRGMKADAWEGGHRMPFIARWSARIKAGSVSGQTVGFTDVMATLAAICGTPLPDDAGPDSFSFLPVLDGTWPEEKPIRPPLVIQAGRHKTMLVRSGEWKLILGDGTGGLSAPGKPKRGSAAPLVHLYNLREDPGETTDLAKQHPEKVVELVTIRGKILDRGRSR